MTSFSHAVLQEGVDVQIIWLPRGHARACVLAYNRLTEVQRYGTSKSSDAIEIHDGITFDFYMGLPHMYLFDLFCFA